MEKIIFKNYNNIGDTMIKLFLQDDQYPYEGYNHIRIVARAIVLDENNLIIINKVKRDDIFGTYTYLETPGGGVDKFETIEEGLKRELEEELGVQVEILNKIGVVTDYYNLLKRKNINHYYLVKVTNRAQIHHESLGDSLIDSIETISLDKVIDTYNNEPSTKIIKLVKERELPILYEAKKYIK